jgi:hypothetical protein
MFGLPDAADMAYETSWEQKIEDRLPQAENCGSTSGKYLRIRHLRRLF